jgi:diadenosine tetraphosphate (Ap4A) HIT family hydrolase
MMDEGRADCILCRGAAGDAELRRIEVWSDTVWRLTVSLEAEVPGFAYLEPIRHIPAITDLDGEAAHTFGAVLAKVSRVLREETGAELVYVTIFGDSVPHLHVHLAPHRHRDALSSQMIRGEIVVETLESGVEHILSKDFPALPEADLRAVAMRMQQRLQPTR